LVVQEILEELDGIDPRQIEMVLEKEVANPPDAKKMFASLCQQEIGVDFVFKSYAY
jgi:hypothetical protein